MTNIRSGGNTDPVAVGNRAADAWAKADPRAVVLTAASDDGQAALGRAADAFTDAGWTDKARAIEEVASVARLAARNVALASTVAPKLEELLAAELTAEIGIWVRLVIEVAYFLQTTEAGGGWTALAVLHARQPQTVTPDVTRHPHAGILPASLAGAAVRVQVSDRFDERLPELPGPGVAALATAGCPDLIRGRDRWRPSRSCRSCTRAGLRRFSAATARRGRFGSRMRR